MSRFRPECGTGTTSDYCPDTGTALLMTLNAVKAQDGLAHGTLHRNGLSCAVGSYFDVNPKACYPAQLTDDVAAMNDSMPCATPRQRKAMMIRWLKWRLRTIGMPGFANAAKPV